MLPSHLLRMVNVCVSGDYADLSVREKIKHQCIPFLTKHRCEVLAGSYVGRHDRPANFIGKILEDARLIRRTLSHAHRHLVKVEQTNNVVSLMSSTRCRRSSSFAAVASA